MAWVYPIDCAMLAALRNASIKDTEEILKTAKVHWIFLIMSWVYPLDCAMLAAIRNTSIEDTQEILNEARTYVFVKQLPNSSFKLHDEMHRMIEAYVWPEIDHAKELRLGYSQKAQQYLEKAIVQVEKEIVSLKEQDKKEPTRQFELEEKRRQLWVMQGQRLKHHLIACRRSTVKFSLMCACNGLRHDHSIAFSDHRIN